MKRVVVLVFLLLIPFTGQAQEKTVAPKPIRPNIQIILKHSLESRISKESAMAMVKKATGTLNNALVLRNRVEPIDFTSYSVTIDDSPNAPYPVDPDVLGDSLPRNQNSIVVLITDQELDGGSIKVRGELVPANRTFGWSGRGWIIANYKSEEDDLSTLTSTITHEFGHIFGTGHVFFPDSVMCQSSGDPCDKRSLTFDANSILRIELAITIMHKIGFETYIGLHS
ncbi:MAG: hypothetical protein Q7R94_02695 [bacterium]|nr:hypothetical protein [bacterium]